jgi:hypothetical protein
MPDAGRPAAHAGESVGGLKPASGSRTSAARCSRSTSTLSICATGIVGIVFATLSTGGSEEALGGADVLIPSRAEARNGASAGGFANASAQSVGAEVPSAPCPSKNSICEPCGSTTPPTWHPAAPLRGHHHYCHDSDASQKQMIVPAAAGPLREEQNRGESDCPRDGVCPTYGTTTIAVRVPRQIVLAMRFKCPRSLGDTVPQ